MSETMTLLLTGITGLALGTIFFWGLWWTIRRGVSSPQPFAWFFGGLVIRMSIVLVGFYFVSNGHWERLLVCLLGFVAARIVVTQKIRQLEQNFIRCDRETSHAP